jgi:hypothetical protein
MMATTKGNHSQVQLLARTGGIPVIIDNAHFLNLDLPREWDVLCGKGKERSQHLGNQRFKATIALHAQNYIRAGNQERAHKTEVVKTVLRHLRSSSVCGCGFFEKTRGDVRGGRSFWIEILNERTIRDKIGHALREISGTISRSTTSGEALPCCGVNLKINWSCFRSVLGKNAAPEDAAGEVIAGHRIVIGSTKEDPPPFFFPTTTATTTAPQQQSPRRTRPTTTPATIMVPLNTTSDGSSSSKTFPCPVDGNYSYHQSFIHSGVVLLKCSCSSCSCLPPPRQLPSSSVRCSDLLDAWTSSSETSYDEFQEEQGDDGRAIIEEEEHQLKAAVVKIGNAQHHDGEQSYDDDDHSDDFKEFYALLTDATVTGPKQEEFKDTSSSSSSSCHDDHSAFIETDTAMNEFLTRINRQGHDPPGVVGENSFPLPTVKEWRELISELRTSG